ALDDLVDLVARQDDQQGKRALGVHAVVVAHGGAALDGRRPCGGWRSFRSRSDLVFDVVGELQCEIALDRLGPGEIWQPSAGPGGLGLGEVDGGVGELGEHGVNRLSLGLAVMAGVWLPWLPDTPRKR